jgi:hypothetical protein
MIVKPALALQSPTTAKLDRLAPENDTARVPGSEAVEFEQEIVRVAPVDR